jgi:hypothetical protein
MVHSLSFNLTCLFRSGKCTPEKFADLTGLSADYVRHAARTDALKIPPGTRFEISKVLSGYMRRFPVIFEPPMRAAIIRQPDDTERPDRGVFEEPPTFGGVKVFTVWAERECQVEIRWPAHRATPEKIEGLWRVLDKEFPEKPNLKAI